MEIEESLDKAPGLYGCEDCTNDLILVEEQQSSGIVKPNNGTTTEGKVKPNTGTSTVPVLRNEPHKICRNTAKQDLSGATNMEGPSHQQC